MIICKETIHNSAYNKEEMMNAPRDIERGNEVEYELALIEKNLYKLVESKGPKESIEALENLKAEAEKERDRHTAVFR